MTTLSPIKIYLDSNVVMKYILEKDDALEKIFQLSKECKIETYVSILSFQEIATSASLSQSIISYIDNIKDILVNNNVNIFYNYDINLISGTVNVVVENLTYEDLLHLKIAENIGVEYFITYDKDILNKKSYGTIKIFEPSSFIQHFRR